MKKSLISLTLLATLVFGADYTHSLDMAVKDADTLNEYAMGSLDDMVKSKEKLATYEAKLNAYADEIATLSQKTSQEFTSKQEAEATMDKLEELSSKNVVMAKEVAYLSAHQSDNMSDDYKATLKTVSETTLRLSDDIGVMSDRILKMADKIGVMADRIVKTQQIQSRNLQATNQLVQNSMQLASGETGATRMVASSTMQNGMQNSQNAGQGMQQNVQNSQPQGVQGMQR